MFININKDFHRKEICAPGSFIDESHYIFHVCHLFAKSSRRKRHAPESLIMSYYTLHVCYLFTKDFKGKYYVHIYMCKICDRIAFWGVMYFVLIVVYKDFSRKDINIYMRIKKCNIFINGVTIYISDMSVFLKDSKFNINACLNLCGVAEYCQQGLCTFERFDI